MTTVPRGAGSPDGLPKGDAAGADHSGAAAKAGDILTLLSRAWRNVTLYGTDHPVAKTAIGNLYQVLQQRLIGRPTVRLFVQDGTFFEDARVLLEETLRFYSLLSVFTERCISAVQFESGVERWELERFIEVLALKPQEIAERGGAEAHLRARGVQHITVGAVVPAGPGAAAGAPEDGGETGPAKMERTPAKIDPQDAYRAGLRVMDELTYRASVDLPLNLAKARTVVNYFIEILGDERAAMLGVAALKNYDEDTYHHSVNVCVLSLLLASHLNMDRTRLVAVGLAGLLHDIGKVRVPHAIIRKPGKLTPEEMEIVKRHPLHGAHILRELPDFARLAMVAAFEHHAGYNLSGYPQIRAKRMPHLVTRIVFVADCFDAMTSTRRAYRDAKRVDEALKEILDGAGTLFDPVLAKLFCKYCRAFLVAAEDTRSRLRPTPAATTH
jgi:putative nucleotidyltransferase with HDIG domain